MHCHIKHLGKTKQPKSYLVECVAAKSLQQPVAREAFRAGALGESVFRLIRTCLVVLAVKCCVGDEAGIVLALGVR